MSKIALEGNASGTGTFTIAGPNTNTNYTITLPQETGTLFTTGATTGLNASALSTGTVATARLASGTANNTTFLRGDQTWAVGTSGPPGPPGPTGPTGPTGPSASATFNTVGSYAYVAINSGPGVSGGTYSAGSGPNQIQSFGSQLTNNLSGTWRWMGGTANGSCPMFAIAVRTV